MYIVINDKMLVKTIVYILNDQIMIVITCLFQFIVGMSYHFYAICSAFQFIDRFFFSCENDDDDDNDFIRLMAIVVVDGTRVSIVPFSLSFLLYLVIKYCGRQINGDILNTHVFMINYDS